MNATRVIDFKVIALIKIKWNRVYYTDIKLTHLSIIFIIDVYVKVDKLEDCLEDIDQTFTDLRYYPK